jgi:hypothetical protein
MNNAQRRLILLGCLCTALDPGAPAATLTPAQRHQVSDMQRMAALGATASMRRDSSALTGAKLTTFTIGTSVDAGVADAQLRVDLTATDQIAGLTYMSVFASSANGTQSTTVAYVTGMPSGKVTATLGLPFNAFNAAGPWTVTEVDLYDAAGNAVYVDENALALLGPTTFTVANGSWEQDAKTPTISAGKILTPNVSTATAAAYAGLQFTVSDTGTPKPSGPYTSSAEFCTLDFANCFSMSLTQTYAGLAKVTMKPAAQLYAGYPAGVYYLYTLYATDWAGNARYLTGADFGGETDFSTLFPTGHTISITN